MGPDKGHGAGGCGLRQELRHCFGETKVRSGCLFLALFGEESGDEARGLDAYRGGLNAKGRTTGPSRRVQVVRGSD